ncbi:clostripain-related cysteine peptidase [Bacteroides nordii]|uniref:clostripain-related cysteine peptidase n=1 Tax=Bacteroides nordii TaxID=291645 RepID=UPI00242E4815|nr:clostripain-related cysteine peptidase [Bacteroides nordii]
MRITILSLLVSFFILTFTACRDDNEAPEAEKRSRTVLVYMVAQNNLSSFAEADFNEMLEGMKSVDDQNNNLIIYWDDKDSKPRLIRLYKDKNGTVKQERLQDYAEQNSVDTEIMKSILNQVYSEYPADSYGLVLWSHADGWAPYPGVKSRSFGDDGGKSMNIADLRKVLEGTRYLNFVFFDACFMQAAEVAYELRQYTDYIVGSPTEIPAPGAPYQVVVPAMFEDEDAAKKIAETYYTNYANTYNAEIREGEYSPWKDRNYLTNIWVAGVSSAVVDCSKLEALATVTGELVSKYVDASITSDNVYCYDKRKGYSYDYNNSKLYYDFADFMKKITGDNDEYKIWEQFFKEAVPYYYTTPKNFSDWVGAFDMTGTCGLSIFIPRSSSPKLNEFYRDYQWYNDAGWVNTGW